MLSKNVINEVIREWSWRVPNGMPDISKSDHLNILKDILVTDFDASMYTVDRVIHSLSGEKIDKQEVQEIAMKAAQPKITKIMNYFKSGKLYNDNILDQVLSLVERDQVEYDRTLAFINGLGIPSQPSQTIVDKIFSYPGENVKKIVNYLSNRSVGFSALKSASDLKSVFSKTGLNSDFLKWLNNFTYPASPSVGSGEIALALLVSGGTKAGGKGDVMIDGKEVEIKGSGGRIKGQKGYSLGTAASKHFSEELVKFISKLDPKDQPMKPGKVPGMGSASYQLGKKSFKNNLFNNTAPLLIKKKVATASAIKKVYEDAMTNVFHGMNVSWIASHISGKGQIKNINSFIDDWFRAALKYYFQIEGFESLIILNRAGKMAYLDKNTDPVGKVKLKATPSFTSGASTQGATFQIDV